MRYAFKFYIILLSFIFFKCSIPEDDLKIPVEIVNTLDFVSKSSIDTKIHLNGGHLIFASFEFDGQRIEGDDIYFERVYENGLQAEFGSNMVINDLRFEIPQGNYQQMSIAFNSYDDTESISILINGSYQANNNIVYPLHFELISSEYFEALAQDGAGNTQIMIGDGPRINVKILFDPILWFSYLPESALDNADLTDVNGVETIILNEDINSELYDLIEERIHEGLKIVVS